MRSFLTAMGKDVVKITPFFGAIALVTFNDLAFSIAPVVLVAGAIGSAAVSRWMYGPRTAR